MEGSITDLSKYHYESVLDDLDTAFRLREKADYQDFVIISKEQTQEQAEKAASDDVENKLIDKVIENMEAEIPQEMYEARIDDMIRDFSYRLQSQGMNLELYLQYTGMEMDSFRMTFEEQAKKQVKIRLALEKIVELENISASEEELEAEYAKLAENYQMKTDEIKSVIPASELKMDLAVNKAIDLVKSSAVIQ